MSAFGPGKLADFFRYYDPKSPQHREAVRQLEARIHATDAEHPEAQRLLRDEASWVVAYRTKPTPPPKPKLPVSIESKVRILAQDDSKSCGQTSVAMAIAVAGGKSYGPQQIEDKYEYALLDALRHEVPPDVEYWDAGNFDSSDWAAIADTLGQGLMPIIGLNGPEFSPSGYGHILGIVGLDSQNARLADPNGGYFRTVSRKLVENCPPHRDGKFLFLAHRKPK